MFTKKGNSKSSLIRTSKKKCKSSSCTSLTKINHKSKNSFEIDQFLTYACKKWIFTMYLRVSAINYILFDMIICIQHSMLTSLLWSCSFFINWSIKMIQYTDTWVYLPVAWTFKQKNAQKFQKHNRMNWINLSKPHNKHENNQPVGF